MRDDVIPMSCVVAAVAVCLHLVARCATYLLLSGPSPLPIQLTGMAAMVASLRTHAAACDDRGTVDVAALDAWYRRHMTFEIVNLAGVLQYFADGKFRRLQVSSVQNNQPQSVVLLVRRGNLIAVEVTA